MASARLFERALAVVGTDYLSHPIWLKYLEYEENRREWGRVAALYTRLLKTPLQQLDNFYHRYCTVLYCTVLYSHLLCYAVLYSIVQYCPVLF